MKFVLKNSVQSLLKGFLYEDVKFAFEHLKSDFQQFLKERPGTPSLSSFKDATIETVHILKEIPRRMKMGFNTFREDFIEELDRLEDPKDKAIFCMKVIGALSSFVAGIVYDIRRSGAKIHLPGMANKTALSDFLLTELVVCLSQLFVLRFIGEIEKHVSNEEELSKLRFFRQMLAGKGDPENAGGWKGDDPKDKAFQLVDSFRNYIIYGKKS